MNLLTANEIIKAYSEQRLFDKASFSLAEGEKVGVIGVNGAGKSTLLKMIAGLEETDEGVITRANHVVIEYLPQNPEFKEEETVLESVVSGKFTEKTHQADISQTESDARAMLMKLGITEFSAKCKTLSGGQRKRIALVKVLLAPSDILILDEPTNHLDNEMADWLEETLIKRKGALIMVTHDRYFLDSVSNRIIEIDRGQIYSYQTNYTGFLELKAEREEMLQASERKRRSILRTELEWVKRGARARSTKQKARLERYEELKNRKAPQEEGRVVMDSVHTRMGKTTVELSHISKAYGDKKLIEDFSYIFLKQDRVGFIGKNGCGKTTLMKIITGQCKPDQGELIVGQTVKIGYYAQEIGKDMNPKQRVIDYIRDVAEYVQTVEGQLSASAMLERFLFEGSGQYSLIGKLSGGEKRRLYLLRVLMDAPNVLILDEPTNDLDIQTLTILEDYLDSFAGIVMMVSHDRYFLDRTARRLFAFENGGKLVQYEGGYSDYRLRKEMQEQETEEKKKPPMGKTSADSKASWKVREKKLKFTFQEQKDYETIEEEMTQIEERLARIEEEIPKAATDFVRLNELTEEKQALEQKQEEKMERWMYLEDLAERIAVNTEAAGSIKKD